MEIHGVKIPQKMAIGKAPSIGARRQLKYWRQLKKKNFNLMECPGHTGGNKNLN